MNIADYINVEASDRNLDALQKVAASVFSKAPILEQFIVEYDIKLQVLEPNQKFGDVRKIYKQYDDDPMSYCQGLYDHEARQIVLREVSELVLSHEAIHLIDYLEGEGYKPFSSLDDMIQKTFKARKIDGGFISGYASLKSVEFWAESCRAFLGFSRQPPGRPSDYERLQRIDRAVADLAADFIKRASVSYAKSKNIEAAIKTPSA